MRRGSRVTPDDLEGRAHEEQAGVSVEVTGSAMLFAVPVSFPCRVIHQPVRNSFLELRREARAETWRLFLHSGDTQSPSSLPIQNIVACLICTMHWVTETGKTQSLPWTLSTDRLIDPSKVLKVPGCRETRGRGALFSRGKGQPCREPAWKCPGCPEKGQRLGGNHSRQSSGQERDCRGP